MATLSLVPPKCFVVRTATGYVGRYNLSGAVSGNMPAARAYAFDTAEAAQRSADEHGGKVLACHTYNLRAEHGEVA